MLTNKINKNKAIKIVELGFKDWNERNKIQWKIDMTWLLRFFKSDLSETTIGKLKNLK